MSIAPSLVVACLVLLMLLGIFIVIYAIVGLARSNKAGDESESSIPWLGGKEIKLKGPAWLVLVAIGSLMVASPLVAAFAQKPSDVTVPPITLQRVQQDERLPEENNPSFLFVSDLSVLDLRQSQLTPWYKAFQPFASADEKKKVKPTILRNIMVVRKIAPANELVVSYSTSGTLVVRCLTHEATYKEKQVTQSGSSTDTWAVSIDVSAMPIYSNFEVIIEATYYNAFSDAHGSYYSTYANKQTESEDLSVALIFPDDKRMKSLTVMEYPPNGGPGASFSGIGRGFPPENKGNSYYWTTKNTRPDYYYKLAWTW